jgi:hypothetical protein
MPKVSEASETFTLIAHRPALDGGPEAIVVRRAYRSPSMPAPGFHYDVYVRSEVLDGKRAVQDARRRANHWTLTP